MLTEDVVHRSIDSKGRLLTKKLISKTNSAPKWTERFLPSKLVYIIEESILDTRSKTLITYTRNIGMKHLMSLEEKVVYKPSTTEAGKATITEKQAWVNSAFYGLSSAIQRFGLERYKQNIKKTQKGFIYTLENIYGKSKECQKIDHFNASNPILKKKLRQSASMATEYAKSMSVPVVIAESED